MTLQSARVVFPGLNGVRAVAAIAVLLDHVELFKGYLGLRALWPEDASAHLGAVGVTVFFVLSGFLITHLLLEEQCRVGTVHVGNFYVRRILRIWPLYYFVVLLSFLVIPRIEALALPEYSAPIAEHYWERFVLYVCFLPNVAFVWFSTLPFGNVLWSVGVEEQFYLVWPWIVRGRKSVAAVIVGCLVGYMVVRVATSAAVPAVGAELAALVHRSRFSCMMIGGLAAVTLRSGGPAALRIAYHPCTQVCAAACVVGLLVPGVSFPYRSLIQHEVISLGAALLILNIATNPRSLLQLRGFAFDWFGKVSYGLYVYHAIVAALVLRLALPLYAPAGLGYFAWCIFVILATLALTAGVSWLSYVAIERPFLRQKERFAVVASGGSTRAE